MGVFGICMICVAACLQLLAVVLMAFALAKPKWVTFEFDIAYTSARKTGFLGLFEFCLNYECTDYGSNSLKAEEFYIKDINVVICLCITSTVVCGLNLLSDIIVAALVLTKCMTLKYKSYGYISLSAAFASAIMTFCGAGHFVRRMVEIFDDDLHPDLKYLQWNPGTCLYMVWIAGIIMLVGGSVAAASFRSLVNNEVMTGHVLQPAATTVVPVASASSANDGYYPNQNQVFMPNQSAMIDQAADVPNNDSTPNKDGTPNEDSSPNKDTVAVGHGV